MNFVAKLKFTYPNQRLIKSTTNWVILDAGIDICEQVLHSHSWQKMQKIIIVRQRLKDCLKALG
jgi:hypothetical protein